MSFSGNVLLLRNAVNLSTEITEVSSSKLLSLIAETLIDTNVINGVLTMLCFTIDFSWFPCVPLCLLQITVSGNGLNLSASANLKSYDDVGSKYQAVC